MKDLTSVEIWKFELETSTYIWVTGCKDLNSAKVWMFEFETSMYCGVTQRVKEVSFYFIIWK